MATQKRNALGRGLDALLSMDDVKTEGSSSINEIELAKITVNPNQPRREFDETALQELADSIAEIGIIQPITLRKLSDDEYQIIAGERRYRASQRAGLKTIPAYIRTADDENMMEMALIENIQREEKPAFIPSSANLSGRTLDISILCISICFFITLNLFIKNKRGQSLLTTDTRF